MKPVKKNNRPAFQWYPRSYLGDGNILLMSWEARGMHVHLLCIAWHETPPGSLPNDDGILCKWLGHPRRWSWLKQEIFRAWELRDGRWYHEGLLIELTKQETYAHSRAVNSEKRWKNQDSDIHSQMHMDFQKPSRENAVHPSSSSSLSKKKDCSLWEYGDCENEKNVGSGYCRAHQVHLDQVLINLGRGG